MLQGFQTLNSMLYHINLPSPRLCGQTEGAIPGGEQRASRSVPPAAAAAEETIVTFRLGIAAATCRERHPFWISVYPCSLGFC